MKFRKKPVVIEAEVFNPTARWVIELEYVPDGVRPTSYKEIAKLLGTSGCSKEEPSWSAEVLGIIDTLEGPHVVSPGDWVITGVKGEKYPRKPDIFEATYEPMPPEEY